MNLLRQTIKRLLTACLPTERWLVCGRTARGIQGPAISLTFDDGPHPDYTPLVLDRLQMYGWKGTFFVIGERAVQHPEILQRIVDEGHELGNHSFSHSEPKATPTHIFLDEVRDTQELLEQLAGQPVTLMRPPKGELTWSKVRGLWRDRQTIALWSVDPKDYRSHGELELRRWAATYEPRHGEIILLHDAFPQVLSVLDALQEHRRLIGTETVTLSTWLPARTRKRRGESSSQRQSPEGLPCP